MMMMTSSQNGNKTAMQCGHKKMQGVASLTRRFHNISMRPYRYAIASPSYVNSVLPAPFQKLYKYSSLCQAYKLYLPTSACLFRYMCSKVSIDDLVSRYIRNVKNNTEALWLVLYETNKIERK